MNDDLINFELPAGRSSIIKVIGVGGGGGNAVNHMFHRGIKDVDFVVCNTDALALKNSPVTVKIQLGETLTEGRGAGNKPAVGKQAALEALEDITEVLSNNTKMVFVTAGMGGGTGTGAAPVIARAAKEMGILTVAIVTIPFRFEGQLRINQAIEGITELQKYVDSLLVISNDKLREMYGDLKLSQAFARADDVLATAAKGIAEIITVHGYINVDFADVETVMKNSGVALLGSASAAGENRAIKAIESALSSPLLNNNDITGAKSILLNITSGSDEISMDEIGEITDYVNQAADKHALIIWGTGTEETLGDAISVTIIATGFESHSIPELYTIKKHFDKVPLRESEKYTGQQFNSEKYEIVDDVVNNTTNQKAYEFLFTSENEEKAEQYTLFGDIVQKITKEEADKKRMERMDNIRNINKIAKNSRQTALTDNDRIDQLENEPAYIRKNLSISDSPNSADSNISRYSLSEDEDNVPRLRDDNSFLHDNVD